MFQNTEWLFTTVFTRMAKFLRVPSAHYRA